LDFDHVGNVEDFKAEICSDNYVFAAFTSPSGDGLKVIVKIPANKETHGKSLKALQRHFTAAKMDDLKDLSRLCFESWDPEMYVNEASEVFPYMLETVTVQTPPTHAATLEATEIFNRLKKWKEGQSSYTDGNKYLHIVAFAAALNRFGVSEFEAANLLRSEYQHQAGAVDSGDFEKIVKKVYNSYSGQHGMAKFEVRPTSTNYAYNTKTKQATTFADAFYVKP